jgi:hypothetical protein
MSISDNHLELTDYFWRERRYAVNAIKPTVPPAAPYIAVVAALPNPAPLMSSSIKSDSTEAPKNRIHLARFISVRNLIANLTIRRSYPHIA